MKKLLAILFMGAFFTLNAQNTYFQQKVEYKIKAKYNPATRILSASEKMKYTNNSPDTLHFIYFHVWANAYKNRKTPYAKQKVMHEDLRFYFAKEEERGWCDSLDFRVNGKPVKTEKVIEDGEIIKLILNEPLLPGHSVEISTPFRVKMPRLFSRMGVDKEMIAFTQWYPKPAVYDNRGWHYFPYLDLGEFYSEFGSFDVELTVPEKYIVAATGDLKTASEYEIYRKMANAAATGKYMQYPAKNGGYKTLRFTQDRVHDFAWFISEEFVPRTDTLQLSNGKTVEIWTFDLMDADKYWKDKFLKIAKRSVKYLSEWNFPYPYSTCKVVFGGTTGGGMEYPTITIIDKPYVPSGKYYAADISGYDEVIFHEIGHNWFYGILGFNEREYPFLDEGINTSNQLRYMLEVYPEKKSSYFGGLPWKSFKHLSYLDDFRFSSTLLESFGCNIPPDSRSEEFSPIAYGIDAYSKTAYAFYALRQYMSDEVYDSAMHNLFKRFAFKHPYPEDVEKVFSESYGEDLSWFFDTILGSPFVQDYKIKGVAYSAGTVDGKFADTLCFSYKKKGKIAAPVYATVSRSKDISYTLLDDYISRKKVDTSCTSFYSTGVDGKPLPPPEKVSICEQSDFMEMPWANNTIYNRKLFKRFEPLKFEPLLSLQTPDYNYVNYFPVVYYSYDKGFSAGVALYNTSVYFKKWQYLLMPMFNFSKGTMMSGTAKLTRYWITYASRSINYVFSGVSFNSFRLPFHADENYLKINWNAGVKLKNKYKFNKAYWKVTDNNILLTSLEEYQKSGTNKLMYVNILEAKYKSYHTLFPRELNIAVENSADYSKIYLAFYQRVNYDRRKHYVAFKLYGGKFLFNNTPDVFTDFKLNGNNPATDYLYSSTYMNINSTDNFLYIAGYPQYFRSSDMIAGGSIIVSSPLKFVAGYFSGAYLPVHDYLENKVTEMTRYEAGILINILNGVADVRIPLVYSDNPFGGYKTDIFVSFNVNLNKLNPFDLYEETVTVRF